MFENILCSVPEEWKKLIRSFVFTRVQLLFLKPTDLILTAFFFISNCNAHVILLLSVNRND